MSSTREMKSESLTQEYINELIKISQSINSDDLIKLTTFTTEELIQKTAQHIAILSNQTDPQFTQALYELGLVYEQLSIQFNNLNEKNIILDTHRPFIKKIMHHSNHFFIAAADRGYVESQLKAGRYFNTYKYYTDLYNETISIEERNKIRDEDERLGVHYYKMAADQGNLAAIKMMMSLYFKGQGVLQNYEIAIQYLTLARSKCGNKISLKLDLWGNGVYGWIVKKLDQYKKESEVVGNGGENLSINPSTSMDTLFSVASVSNERLLVMDVSVVRSVENK